MGRCIPATFLFSGGIGTLGKTKAFKKILLGSNRNKTLVPYKYWVGVIAGLAGFCQTLYNSDSIFGVLTGQEA